MEDTKTQEPRTALNLFDEADALIDELLDAEGVTDEDLDRRIAEFEGDINLKVDRCGYAIRRSRARAEAFKEEIDRLTARKKSIEKVQDRTRAYMFDLLTTNGKISGSLKVKTERFTAWIAARESVSIADEEQLQIAVHGTEFVEYVPKLDKAAIKKALKLGEYDFEGLAVMVMKPSLTIR